MTLDVDIFWCWLRDASFTPRVRRNKANGQLPPFSHAVIAALKLTSLVVHVAKALRKENARLKLKNTHTHIYIYITWWHSICMCVCVHWFMHSTRNHLGGSVSVRRDWGHWMSLGSSDPRLRGSKDLAHREAPGKPHISHGRVADFMEIDAEGLTGHIYHLSHKKDPWCCYICCAMDPINIPPIMLAYIYIIHGSYIIYHHLSSSIILYHPVSKKNHGIPWVISTWVTWHRCRASRDLRRWSIGRTSHRHWCWHWSWSEQLRLLVFFWDLGSGLTWVCLKIVYPIVLNGFADHYPY